MHNQVAVRILLLEKEWGLFKYHGASGYLQRKWASGSTLPNNEPDHEQKNDKKEDDTAQIAFMITSRMKQQLQEALGYSETLIKSMTPLQASLVLKYQILPYEYNGKLPQLEEDYHIQQEQKRQAEQEKRTRHSQLEQEGNQSAAVNESFSTSTESSNSPQVPLETSSPSTASMLFNDNLPTGRTRIKWYEVIQTQPNGEETKLGLYRTPEEAQEGVDALKYIAEKRQEMNRTQLSIRPSLR